MEAGVRLPVRNETHLSGENTGQRRRRKRKTVTKDKGLNKDNDGQSDKERAEHECGTTSQ